MGTVWTEPEKYLTEIHQALGCHSAYMVEEIERLKDREDELGQQVTTLERDKSQLRADLDAAQRERDEALARVAELQASRAELAALHARIAELEAQAATLRPHVYACDCVAREEEMRERAAMICEDWNLAPYTLDSNLGGDTIPIAKRLHLADAIRALPLQSEAAHDRA